MAITRTRKPKKPLAGQVALVAGATRGAGRGIAMSLAEAGALVYCTGRSMKGKPSSYKRNETIHETAALIKQQGGEAIAIRVDHTSEEEVAALFRKILKQQKRLDIVVDSVAGEDPLMKVHAPLWKVDLTKAQRMLKQGVLSHIITAKHAVKAMLPARRGLIVQVTENDILGGGYNAVAHSAKALQKILPLHWAVELAPHHITTVAITPGFLRSEKVLEYFGVTEANWRDGGEKDKNFLASESPRYVGRAIAAMAADKDLQRWKGMLLSSWELADYYRVTDCDGSTPSWGDHTIDFSELPQTWVDWYRLGTALEAQWHSSLAERCRKFLKKVPQ